MTPLIIRAQVDTSTSTPPAVATADIKVNGSDDSVELAAPATYTVSWTSSNTTSCSTSGTSGSQMGSPVTSLSGSRTVSAQSAGSYTYTITCDGASDSVTITVTQPISAGYTGYCMIRNSYTSIPSATAADTGTGYAKVSKGTVASLEELRSACSDSDYSALLSSYCSSNTEPVMREVVLYSNNAYYSNGSAAQGSSQVSCPSTATAPTTPSGLTAAVSGSSVTLTWTDNSNNETGFKLYKTISGLWTDIGNVSANTTTYTDTNVTAGSSYSYKVQAYYQSGSSYPLYSGVSNVVTVTAGAAIDNPQATTTISTIAILTGTVTDANGQPLARIGVHAYSSDYRLNYGGVTDSSGTFSLTMQAGRFLVEILPPSDRTDLIKPQPASIDLFANQTQNLALQFRAAALANKVLSGSVSSTDSQPITDAVVGAYNTMTGQWITAPTNAEGRYSLSLGPGTWKVSLRPASSLTATWLWAYRLTEITFADNNLSESKSLDFTVAAATGKIIVAAKDEAGQVLANAGVEVSPSGSTAGQTATNITTQFKKTDSQGQASFNLPPGSYVLRFFAPAGSGFINPSEQQVTLAVGQESNLPLVFIKPQLMDTAVVSVLNKLDDGTAAGDAAVWAWSEQGGFASGKANTTGMASLNLAMNQRWHIGAGKMIDSFSYKSAEVVISVTMQSQGVELVLVRVSDNPLPQTVTVSRPANEPVIAQTEGGAGVVAPAGSVSGASTLQIEVSPTAEAVSQQSARVVGTAYDINAKDQSGTEVKALDKEVEVILPYTIKDLAKQGISADKLVPSYYDETVGAWVKLDDYTVDKANNKIIARVNHFTRFALLAPADVTPPLAPLNVKGYRTGKTELTLMWVDPKVDFHHAKVYRSTKAKDMGILINPIETESYFKDVDVKANQRYYYRLVAVDAAGNESAFTNPVMVRVSGGIKRLAQPPKTTTFTKYLSKGRKDNEVKYLQQALQNQGIYELSVPVTGVYDNYTVTAVKQFQKSKGIKQSGVLDTLTRQALNKL